MLQYESDIARGIEIGNQLHMILQSVISQLLIFGGTHRIGLNQRRRAFELKVTFELKRESINLVERSLPDGLLQHVEPVQMMRIVPIDLAQFQVSPVLDMALRQ